MLAQECDKAVLNNLQKLAVSELACTDMEPAKEKFILPPYERIDHLKGASDFEKRRYLCFQQKWPRFLYKYKNFTNESFLRDYIVESDLYLSSRAQLNDPFDIQAELFFENSGKARIEYLNGLYKAFNISYKDRKALAKRLSSPAAIQRELRKSFNKQMENVGFHSFSETPRSLLMWSHYSNSHEGLCLVFDTTKDINVFVRALPVKYLHNYPVIHYSGELKGDFVKKAFLTKSKDWKYEEERRIFEGGRPNQHLGFRPEALRAIILGCRVQPKAIEILARLLQERRDKNMPEIMLFKASMSKLSYKLDFHKTQLQS